MSQLKDRIDLEKWLFRSKTGLSSIELTTTLSSKITCQLNQFSNAQNIVTVNWEKITMVSKTTPTLQMYLWRHL